MIRTVLLAGVALFATAASAQEAPLLPVKADVAGGKILVTLPAPGPDGTMGRFIHATMLRSGMGTADIRVDRGMQGSDELLAFRRVGRKIAVVYENPRFRAGGGTAAETAGVSNSFAVSTLALLDPVETLADGRVTVDLAGLLAKDTANLAARLNASTAEGRGDGVAVSRRGFKLVEALSTADPASVKVFPTNIEVDSWLTFSPENPGREVMQTVPDPRSVTVQVHHSIIKLPEPGFVTRSFDIRSAANGMQVFDFNQPLGRDVVMGLAVRFRLEKTDPTAARSPVKKPIIFYIDSAAPEPVRSALRDGVGWWSQAFDAAGFIGGFRAEILPQGIDPLDARYNIVTWGSRLTRSWSYGQTISDPRTGEIIKGSVVLGALRVRQDVNIFESMVGAAATGKGRPNDPAAAALSRIRQLGAHEVGHAIGFMHNFAGSTQGDTSVMDYPMPYIALKDGKIDISRPYGVGIGSWDKFTVDWLYGDPAPGQDPDAHAATKMAASVKAGARFLTDIDGRAGDSPTPWSNMWDNGPEPAAELRRLLEVRKVGLANFGEAAILPGVPMAELRRRFVLVWLLHRYQVEAAGKLVGGVDYKYTVAGDGEPLPAPVPAAMQAAALDALFASLDPAALTVPDRLVMLLSAGVNGRGNPQFSQEVFQNAGGAVFDPLVAADVGAQAVLESLLAPTRLTRLNEQNRRDSGLPGAGVVIDRLIAGPVEGSRDAVARRVGYRTIVTLARTMRDPSTSPDVAALIEDRLALLGGRLARAGGSGEGPAWSRSMARLLSDPERLERDIAKLLRAPDVPPGMPIGGMSTDGAYERDFMDDL
ncbi:hypothetical protein FHS79_002880 [Polymorphobacter multimanifer]|uniref:DUF5117 domain-containing protein n=1 Tax=Polymorphobacter multimanifer TaxID=1070431 RepID=A0A841L8C7_9SPHN|nr:zinc-dependent metalloprotease [Polymorphobacter multimanifer]MBB6228690.1 hypothetical protein [Polymorphobacter multimanifer]